MAPAQIICIWIPRFALTAAGRSQPPAAKPPGAVYDAAARGQPLLACRADLEARGMAPGLSLREAQARWPEEPLLPVDLEATVKAFEPVLGVLDTFSPFVENAAPGQAYLDGSGLERRYGSPRKLSGRLRRAIQEAAGFEPNVGVAAGKFVAEVAARSAGSSGVRVVPPGRETEALADLPVSALGLEPASVQRLRALGVRSVRRFARLPAGSILHRYGPSGWRAYQGLHGKLREPLRARRHPVVVHDLLDFEWVEHNPDRLLFACKMLSDHLAGQLARHHLACRTLQVRWTFDDGAQRERELRLAEPTARAETLLRYLRWHLDGLQVARGIVGIRLRAGGLTDSGGWQLKLLAGPNARVPDFERRRRALDILGRLRARWGETVARQPEPIEARRPERGFRWTEVTLPELDGDPPPGPRLSVPYWLLDPPQPVRVVDETAPRPSPIPPHSEPPLPEGEGRGEGAAVDHPPLPNRERAGVRVPTRRILIIEGAGHVVAQQAGPWRLHDAPWRADEVERDYYQFEATTGAAFLLFRDRSGGGWFLQGVYD